MAKQRIRLSRLFKRVVAGDEAIYNMPEDYEKGWYAGFAEGRELQRNADIEVALSLAPTKGEEERDEKVKQAVYDIIRPRCCGNAEAQKEAKAILSHIIPIIRAERNKDWQKWLMDTGYLTESPPDGYFKSHYLQEVWVPYWLSVLSAWI